MKYTPDYGGQPRFSCPRTMHELREEEKRRKKNPPAPKGRKPTPEEVLLRKEKSKREEERFWADLAALVKEIRRRRG